MQPTQQTVIPVSLFRGYCAVGTTTVDLDSTYDHVITHIMLLPYSGSALSQVSIVDDDGAAFWGGQVQYGEALIPQRLSELVHIVLQSETSLAIYVYDSPVLIGISADRLAPSAATIFA